MSTNENETLHEAGEKSSGVNRRTIIRGAAWSVPVVAAMSIAPLAAASGISDATVLAGGGSAINFTDPTGTQVIVNGTLTGQINIVNVTGTWETGELTGSYRISGAVAQSSVHITWPDGSEANLGTTYTDAYGRVWTVIRRDPTRVDLQGPSVKFDHPSSSYQSIPLPELKLVGNYTGGPEPTADNPVVVSVYVTVPSKGANGTANSSSTFPSEE